MNASSLNVTISSSVAPRSLVLNGFVTHLLMIKLARGHSEIKDCFYFTYIFSLYAQSSLRCLRPRLWIN